MAYRIARADGAWTAAATWGEVDATSLLDAQNFNTNLGTTFTTTQTFTPGAITIDGIAVKVATRASTPTGTMTVRLSQGGSEVAGTTVTIDVADLPENAIAAAAAFQGCSIGWVFFAFASPVTLSGATAYAVQALTSSAAQVALFRNNTGSNWSRLLRTTTTGAPGAGDCLFVVPAWTAAGTRTVYTVTMDNTASTDFGSTDTSLASVGIGDGCTLQWATTPATDLLLKLSGVLAVWVGGTYEMGGADVGDRIPRDSTAILEFDCAADGDFGVISFGTFHAGGLSRTDGLDVAWALLAADVSASGTTLTVDRETGWLAGDEIGIAGTARATTGAETATLDSNATDDTLEVTSGLSNAHDGTDPVVAEVVNLTRSVKIRSASNTAMSYVTCVTGSMTWRWVEGRYLGSAQGNKHAHVMAYSIATTVAPITLEGCAFVFGEGAAVEIGAAANVPTVAVTECVAYGVGAVRTGVLYGGHTSAAAPLALTIRGWVSIGTSQNISGVSMLGPTVLDADDVRVSGAVTSAGVSLGSTSGITTGRIRRLHVHGVTNGFTINAGVQSLRVESFRVWRCTTGLWLGGSHVSYGLDFVDGLLFGSSSRNILLDFANNYRFLDCVVTGESANATQLGLDKANAALCRVAFQGCTFGLATGIYDAHVSADIGGATIGRYEFTLVNTQLLSATRIHANVYANAYAGSYLAEQRVDGVTDTAQTFIAGYGTIARDETVYRTAAPSERLTPVSLDYRLPSGTKRRTVRSGNTLTFGVYVRKDGTFNGTARLMLRANAAIGLDADVELAAFSGAADTWVQLSGAMPAAAEEDGVVEAYVEVTGSAGNIYTDDWSAAEA